MLTKHKLFIAACVASVALYLVLINIRGGATCFESVKNAIANGEILPGSSTYKHFSHLRKADYEIEHRVDGKVYYLTRFSCSGGKAVLDVYSVSSAEGGVIIAVHLTEFGKIYNIDIWSGVDSNEFSEYIDITSE